MSLLDQSYRDRAEAQLRRINNEAVARSESVNRSTLPHDDPLPLGAQASSPGVAHASEARLIALLPLGVIWLIVLLSRGVMGTAVAVIASLPTGILLLALTRALSKYSDFRLGRALLTAFLGIALYLGPTAVIGFTAYVFGQSNPSTSMGIRVAGFIGAHAPGVILAALQMMLRVDDEPYLGFVGFLKACVVMSASIALGLGGTTFVMNVAQRLL